MQDILTFLHLTQADLDNLLRLIKYPFLVYTVGLLIEYFIPAEKNQPSENIRFNIVYTVNFVLLNTLLFGFLNKIQAPVVAFLGGPYFTFNFGDSIIGQILHPLVFFLIFDFFYYWFHRWQHKSHLFWAQHQFHHAEESLNVTTGNRHHWMEDSLRIFVVLIPMFTLFKFKADSVGLIWSTFMLWGYFIHLNIKLNFGFMTPVLGGPQVHRIHHSNLKPHLDKNFAAFFPIYDILFKTYYRPKKEEYPTTGLYKGKSMNNFKDANFYPFIYWYKNLKK